MILRLYTNRRTDTLSNAHAYSHTGIHKHFGVETENRNAHYEVVIATRLRRNMRPEQACNAVSKATVQSVTAARYKSRHAQAAGPELE
ncbi:unnamed protein product [Protopolystoma xenopodis]|uniref:Uncharacterized protein n=1 Tax=Protopolystoma xenopodis TaxID=117903 RepID=A0A3S5BZ77_9PLAT|nr:unnamed protein product [Protopolystoma xenopodis]